MRVIADFVPAGHVGKCMLRFDTLPFNKLNLLADHCATQLLHLALKP